MKSPNILLFYAVALFATTHAFAVSKVVTTQTYVDGVAAGKQDLLTGTANSIVTYTAQSGVTGERAIDTSLASATTSDTSIPTAGAVMTALNAKQNLMSGTENTVVTYTGASGGVGSRAIYQDSGTYNSQPSALAQANHVNAAVINAFNAHITCHQYDTSGTRTAEHCLTWNVNSLSGTYIPENQ